MKRNLEALFGLIIAAFGSVFGLIFLFLMVFVPVGWVINLIDVVSYDGRLTDTVEGVLMIVGIIFVPLGAVMGWFA